MSQSFEQYARDYQARFVAAVQGWDLQAVGRMVEVMAATRQRGGQVLVAGNGGSAAICNHLECDASKGTFHAGQAPLMTRSLSSNPSMLTALGNDVGFESIFARQVEYFAKPGDVLLLISSSGNSPNVVQACELAKRRGMTTLAFVGFEGGKLKQMADHVLHIPFSNYGIAEDMHQATMHLITQFLNAAWGTP